MIQPQIFNRLSQREIPFYKLKPLWVDGGKTDAKVQFSFEESTLIINFEIFEEEIRKETTFHNDNVHEDSCVECFFQIPNSDEYYNFELSASSFMKVGRGASRNNRFLFDESIINTIDKKVTIINDNHWKAEIKLDLKKWKVLSHDSIENNKTIKGNFYKCGDKLKKPHYLSLFLIDVKEPNFHIPKFFDKLVFV